MININFRYKKKYNVTSKNSEKLTAGTEIFLIRISKSKLFKQNKN